MWKIFANSTILEECKNVLHIFEILLVTPFTNVKVERVFSNLNKIKTDWWNRLRQKRSNNLMILSEEGPSVEDFNPDHAINAWHSKKMWQVGCETSHKYPAERTRTNTRKIDLARVTLSDIKYDIDSDDKWTLVSHFFVHIFYNVLLSPNLSFFQLFIYVSYLFLSFNKVHSFKKNNAMMAIFKQNLCKKNKKYNITMVKWMNKLDFYTRVHKKYASLVFFTS